VKRYLTIMLVVGATLPAAAAAQPPQRGPLVPLEIELVISRFQGDKKISSVPYVLAVNAEGSEVRLRMGTDVPVYTSAFTPAAGGKDAPQPLRSYSYRSVGTNITSSARSAPENRFELSLIVEDSSVYTGTEKTVPGGEGMPVFRSFNSTNTLLLRDGQTRQYTAAVDRVSGEVVKLDVTLKIVK
jgi:hypothetical protein